MHPNVISIDSRRCSPDTAKRLADWGVAADGVEHIVVRPRPDGGLDAVVYAQSTVDDLAARIDVEVLGGGAS